MRIWIQSGADEIELCGQTNGPADFLLQTNRSMKVLPFVWSDYAKPLAEGNVSRVLTFGSVHEFASTTLAQIFALDLEDEIPAQADVFVEMDDGSDPLTLSACLIEFTPALQGALVRVKWMLRFGKMLSPGRLSTSLSSLLGVDLNDATGDSLTLNDGEEQGVAI